MTVPAPAAGFRPDPRHLVDAVRNRRPQRLPFYEHIVGPEIMEGFLGVSFAHLGRSSDPVDLDRYFAAYAAFWPAAGYDTVSYEVCTTHLLPGHGAIMGGRPGPIRNRADCAAYPWTSLPDRWWAAAGPRFAALARQLPAGAKVVGGVGNGILELLEDLVGYEWLCLMIADDPDLIDELSARCGEFMLACWERLLAEHAGMLCVGRFGDDLGFRSGTLLRPAQLRRWILPRYRPVIDRIHAAGLPFLWHSCGCIFAVMEDAIACGIDAKHSNEDAIAPYDRWIADYGGRIGLLGGIDVDLLCQRPPEEVHREVLARARRFRAAARGWALGSGNSIPAYVPLDGYRAMLRAGWDLRAEEAASAN